MSDGSAARHSQSRVEKLGAHDWVAACVCGKECQGTSRTKVTERLDRHIAAKNHELCPNPGKTAHPTRSAAEKALASTWRMTHGGGAATNVYHCECGSWHLTSKGKLGAMPPRR